MKALIKKNKYTYLYKMIVWSEGRKKWNYLKFLKILELSF